MNDAPDFYVLLGVSSDAEEAEIRLAFASEIKKWHPDTTQGTNGDRARFLIEARDTLTDPVQRRAYDAQRRKPGLVRTAARGASQWIFVCSQGMGQFRTIGEALDAARDGDKIYILPGTYREPLIAVEKSVELAGQGSDDEPVIVEGGDDLLYLPANDVTIRGLCFRTLVAQRIAVRANSQSATISACKFSAPQSTGLLVEGGSRLVVEGCVFERCELGIRAEGASPAIIASKFIANTTGLLVRTGCDCAVENNDFSDNAGAAIVIEGDTSANVIRNRFTGSMGKVGVVVKRTSRGIIDHNRFSGLQGGIFAVDETTEVSVGENNTFE